VTGERPSAFGLLHTEWWVGPSSLRREGLGAVTRTRQQMLSWVLRIAVAVHLTRGLTETEREITSKLFVLCIKSLYWTRYKYYSRSCLSYQSLLIQARFGSFRKLTLRNVNGLECCALEVLLVPSEWQMILVFCYVLAHGDTKYFLEWPLFEFLIFWSSAPYFTEPKMLIQKCIFSLTVGHFPTEFLCFIQFRCWMKTNSNLLHVINNRYSS
jgi:hypothetical protein